VNSSELSALHFTKLKAMLAEKGLEYTDKAAAITILADDVVATAAMLAVDVTNPGELDRSRPFGEVFGDAGGARYAQDNHMFDGDGKKLNG